MPSRQVSLRKLLRFSRDTTKRCVQGHRTFRRLEVSLRMYRDTSTTRVFWHFGHCRVAVLSSLTNTLLAIFSLLSKGAEQAGLRPAACANGINIYRKIAWLMSSLGCTGRKVSPGGGFVRALLPGRPTPKIGSGSFRYEKN